MWLYWARQLPLVSSLLTRAFSVLKKGLGTYLLFRFLSVLSCDQPKQQIRQVLFFCWLLLSLVVWPRLGDLFVSQNLREICASHFLDGFYIVHIPFVRMVKFKLLALFSVDYLPHSVVSSQILFSLIYCIRLLIISSLSPHNLHLLFCFFLSIFALI